jgi:hypothetical protein
MKGDLGDLAISYETYGSAHRDVAWAAKRSSHYGTVHGTPLYAAGRLAAHLS